MKATGYFRAEADAVKGSPSSLDAQEKAYRRLCTEMGLEAGMTFVESDSQEGDGNEQYHRMLDRVRSERKGALVIAKSIAQLHPDPREAAQRLLELEEAGARVVLADEHGADPLEVVLESWYDHARGKDRGKKVKEAMMVRAVRGKGLGRPPFGYKIGADKALEVVPEEAEKVVLIYQLYLQENLGFRLIARYLNERGLTTRNGGRWSMVAVRDILRNRTYTGTYLRFGFRVPESHDSIIPYPMFKRVQERLKAKSKQREYTPRSPFLLSGFLYCGSCGNRMIGVSRHERWTRRKDNSQSEAQYRYYQCQSRTNQSVCQYHTRRAEDLEAEVRKMLERFNSPEALQKWLELHPSSARSPSELAQFEKKLTALEQRLRRSLGHAAQGRIPVDEMRTIGRELVRERRITEQRAALLHPERPKPNGMSRHEWLVARIREMSEQWEAMPVEAKKALLQYVVERIIVYDDHLEISLLL